MRKAWKRVKFVFTFRRSVPFLKDFFLSKEVAGFSKVLSIGLIIGYLWLPFDLIPDFLAVFGLIDDIAIFALVLQQIVKMAPDSIKEKHKME
ncbi:YkvA family protein [Bacillus badius]|uniref:DUF1232 domain-containing protein n=1 Tax=Bacillus badius TaxID=1455 RepID=A0ABR5AWP0_BACBA|nr:DUF1232 domain-containing protein [Bacillus badius]KIL74292.1 hypothetical protein SD78_1361 [Bacillus badius]KIL79172.1 hypothetical protein SD77_3592 [Bacillus badius]KZN99613.1 hypothetical protein A4244_16545 [Bacillus badius]KZR57985.1 hypothetical protein A3781_18910 [Bacillus badius]MED0665866.1 DUF1232 domain-containing protein [Bacillus badius]